MAKKAICTDKTNALVEESELAFINELKSDSESVGIKNPINDIKSYHGMRRNSSFADYFEGDLSQNLLSRSHFTHRDSSIPGNTVDILVEKIRHPDSQDLGLVVQAEVKKKKLSQILLPSNWFFSKKQEKEKENLNCEKPETSLFKRKRTVSEPSETTDLEDDIRNNQESLSNYVGKHFSATADIRALNINMPQSQ